MKILFHLTKQVVQILESPLSYCKRTVLPIRGKLETMSQQAQLIEFLKQELSIPAEAIAMGLRRSASTPNLLPIVLWQYGIVTTHQLNQIFDWLEASVV